MNGLAMSIAFVLVVTQTTQSQQTIWVDEGIEAIQIGSSCFVYEDSAGDLIIDEMMLQHRIDRFQSNDHLIPNFGFSSSTFWFLFSVGNKRSEPSTLVLEIGNPLLDLIRVFVRDAKGKVFVQQAGLTTHTDANVKGRNPVFPIGLTSQESVAVLVQVKSSSAVVVPLMIFKEDDYVRRVNDENLILGMYYGILLLLFVYNLILFFSFRDIVYLCYTVMVLCFGLSQFTFDGFLTHYIPGIPTWCVQHIFPLAYASNIIVAQILTQRLLGTKTNAPEFHAVMNFMKVAGLVALLLILALPIYISYPAVSVLTIVAILALLPPAILRWRQGYQPARPFTLAIAALSVAMLVRMFRNVGILTDITLTIHPVHFGTLLDALFLSVALSDRVNLRKIEHELGRTELRDRLATDLHDDLASTLGSISLFATSLRARLKSPSREVRQLIDRIGRLAGDAVDAIGDIVWSVSPERDTLGQLLIRMRDLTAQLCTANGIHYDFQIKEGLVEVWLDPEVRRNLYLVFKEAIHNAVRHSGATTVTVRVGITKGVFGLYLKDDGKGFRPGEKMQRGHGLRNMTKRAEAIGARFKLESTPSVGTSILVSRRMT